jgi:hypothetical protein
VLGVIGASGAIELMESMDAPLKVEGVLAWPEDGGRIGLLLVADADDPEHPSPLLAATLGA